MDSTLRYVMPGEWAGMSVLEEGLLAPPSDLDRVVANEFVLRLAFFVAGLWTLFLLTIWNILFALTPLPGALVAKLVLMFVLLFTTLIDVWFVVSLFSLVLISSFRVIAFLYHLDDNACEHFYYRIFAIGFTWFYDVGILLNGSILLTYKPFLKILDAIAYFMAKQIDIVSSQLRKFGFLNITKVNPLIAIPRSNFILPFSVGSDFDSEDHLSLTLLSRGKQQVRVWDDGLDTCQPLIYLSLMVVRCAIMFRLNNVSILFLLVILCMYFIGWCVFILVKFGLKGVQIVFDLAKLTFLLAFFCVYAPQSVLLNYSYGFWYFYWHLPWICLKFAFNLSNWWASFYLLKTFCVLSFVRILKWCYYLPLAFTRYSDSGGSVKSKIKLQARFNQSWVAAQRVIDDMALPTFIRRTNFEITPGSIQATFDKLKKLGWPVNVKVTSMPEDLQVYEYPEWFITSFDFHQGIHNMQTAIDEDLQVFEADNNLAYKRTETYASFTNELQATSRYFLFRDYSFTDLAVDDIWVLLGAIFANSRLTPFPYIIKKWEKKYGLGAFAKISYKGKDRKLSRKKFMKQMSQDEFLKLWAETFKWAPTLDPINPVSVKSEALPAKKWMADKVRTVIGAPLTSYISSTIWNYMPNHNFQWESTPIKVGMPLNGGSMSKVYGEHARRDLHFAADCTAFDSTLSGKTLDIIKGLRKKGFENHRDYKNICDLIDSAYWEVQNGVLALTSRGHMYRKGTGLSTGHSSTSMDNSIGLVSLYLRAWKELTGQTAHEFRHFCTLSAYGDDNICSYDKDVHPNWTPLNIQKVFKQWGVEMRIEAQGPLENIEFLSKFCRRPNQQDKELMASLNLPCPNFIIYHNRDKLIGKIKVDAVSSHKMFGLSPEKQVTRIISFMQLTAHHHDVYNGLVNAVNKKVQLIRGRKPSFAVKIPSYEQIMTNWYFKRENIKGFTDDEMIPDDVILNYGQVTIIDAFSNFLSRFADFVNPDVYNSGLTIFLQRPLKPLMEWAVLHTREANAVYTNRHLASIMQKSAYDWMTNEVELPMGVDDAHATSRLFKHWLYMIFSKRKGNFFSRYILMIDKKLADIKYLLFGHIDLQVRRLEVPIWNCVLASFIGCLPDFEGLPDYRRVWGWHFLPYLSVGNLADAIFGMVTNMAFSSVPANFMASNQAFKMAVNGNPWLVEAATGSGKTTSMINAFTHTPEFSQIDKLIVVEPRQSIVLSIVPYMRSKFDMDCTGACEGFKFDPNCKIVYCTPLEVILHEEWFHLRSVFILDECHVDEPLYNFTQKVVRNSTKCFIMTSATPSPFDFGHSVIAGANVWKIEEVSATHVMTTDPSYMPILASYQMSLEKSSYQFSFDIYRRFVIHYLKNANPFAKSLVFVNTKKEALQLAGDLTGPSGGVVAFWSGHTDLPDRWSIIVSTSVADVGLTLPSVDHVFTTNTHIVIRGVDLVKPVFYNASATLLKQRRGRTGRTNNGRFIVFKIPNLETFEGFTPEEHLVGLLSSGIDIDMILKFDFELIATLFGEGAKELVRDTFTKASETVIKPALRWQDGESSIAQQTRLRLESKFSGFTFDLDSIVLHPTRNQVTGNRGWSVQAELFDLVRQARKYIPLGVAFNTRAPHTEVVSETKMAQTKTERSVTRTLEAGLSKYFKTHFKNSTKANKKINEEAAENLERSRKDLRAAEEKAHLAELNVFNDLAAADLFDSKWNQLTWPNWASAFRISYFEKLFPVFIETLDPSGDDAEELASYREGGVIHNLVAHFFEWAQESGLTDENLDVPDIRL